MDFDDDDENQLMEEDYDEEGGDQMETNIDDIPVTQEDAWAVIR
jgi:hypothetical protein